MSKDSKNETDITKKAKDSTAKTSKSKEKSNDESGCNASDQVLKLVRIFIIFPEIFFELHEISVAGTVFFMSSRTENNV